MSAWSISAVVASFLMGAHFLMLRAASGRIGDVLGAVLLEGSATVGLLLLLFSRSSESSATTSAGVVWACASGLCISGVTSLLFFSLRSGGPVSATGPIVLGGGVTIAALAAPFLFSAESFTLRRGIGVTLGFVAIVLLATEKN